MKAPPRDNLFRFAGHRSMTGLAVAVAALLHFSSSGLAAQTPSGADMSSPTSANDPATLYAQGVQYLHGRGVPQDDQHARELFQRAADAGNAEALGSLGFLYSKGRGVEQDDVKARFYFQAGADKGSAAAQMNLGRFLIDGRGGPKEPERGVASIEKAAASGNPAATIMLGEIFYLGEHANGTPDYPRAFATLKDLAEAGNANAQNMIGVMIFDQRIAGLEREAARPWLLKSAAQGNRKACFTLGQWEFESPERERRIDGLKWLLVGKHLKELAAIVYLDDWSKSIKPDEMQAAEPLARQVIESLPKN